MGATVLETEVCGDIWSTDRVCGGIRSAYSGQWGHHLQTGECEGITSADRGKLGASGLQTMICWGIGYADSGVLGASGLPREVCMGIRSAYSGLRSHRVCRVRFVMASVL